MFLGDFWLWDNIPFKNYHVYFLFIPVICSVIFNYINNLRLNINVDVDEI